MGLGCLGKLQGAEVPMAAADGAFPVGAALTAMELNLYSAQR